MQTLELPLLDCPRAAASIESFIRSTVESANKVGVVVGLSGGVDSAVVAALCVRALGPRGVLTLRLFESTAYGSADADDALALSKVLGTESLDIDITPVVNAVMGELPFAGNRIVAGNAKARVRMLLLYAFANHRSLLVAGTGDKSEDLIGFFTKYGDGGVDFLPIAHLYKTQVRTLGRFLGLPDRIVEKASSPNLWAGHKATDEIPLDYPLLDPVLHGLVDLKLSAQDVHQMTDVELQTVKAIGKLVKETSHKRNAPPALEGWPA